VRNIFCHRPLTLPSRSEALFSTIALRPTTISSTIFHPRLDDDNQRHASWSTHLHIHTALPSLGSLAERARPPRPSSASSHILSITPLSHGSDGSEAVLQGAGNPIAISILLEHVKCVGSPGEEHPTV
jgi:hypothetical protein